MNKRGLGEGLQPQLSDVKAFFQPRNMAAHGWIQIFTVGGTKQITRFSFNGWELRGETVTIADFQQELEAVQRGQEALQAVGRSLDADRPGALPAHDVFVRFVVLGEENSAQSEPGA